MFATSAPGLEPILALELNQLGIRAANAIEGGIGFTGSMAELYAANLHLRTASRVLLRVAEFHANSFHELERRAKRVPWEKYLGAGSRVRFRVTCRKSRLYHSDAVAERLAEAMAERVAGLVLFPLSSSSPSSHSPSAEEADDFEGSTDEMSSQLFIVRLARDNCVISLDSSGALLHRRGYRQAVARAPMRETLAAAMVIGSGWDARSPLIDPMCGSGTIAIEAALIARRIAPGLARHFAFESWPDYEDPLWSSLKAKAMESCLKGPSVAIMASDRDDGALKAAVENAGRAGVNGDIETSVRAISGIEPPTGSGWLVTNPPYGVRVGDRSTLRNLYTQLGKIIRQRAESYTVGILSADAILESQLKLDLDEVFRTRNGGIPVRFMVGVVA